nr:hypothetical protein [Tanacetum cinerariifolium]
FVAIERGFLSQKGSGGGRGVMKKNINRKMTNTILGIGLCTNYVGTMNEDSPVVIASTIKECVTPSVVDIMIENDKIRSLDDTTVLESFPTLTTWVTTMTGNAPGKSSYANITGKPSGKKVNVRTLFTPEGNGIDVVVLMDSIRAINERFTNTAYGFFLGKKVAYPVVANYVRNTWGKYGLVRSIFSSSTGLFSFKFSSMDGLDAMLENGPCEDDLSAIATKLGNPLMVDSYTSDMCMQSWGRSSYARVMIELQADVKLKDNIVVAMPKLKREGHYTCNVHVEYEWKPPVARLVRFLDTLMRNVRRIQPNTSSSGIKKKGMEPTIEVSNSNPFDVLNSVDNDVEFGTNGETSNLGNNKAIPSGSSFINIDDDVKFASNTPIGEKIDKIERQIGEGKLRLLDNDKNPLVPIGIVESDSEVKVRDSSPENDEYDPYDDDMYDDHDLSEHLQSICDDLDITVLDRKKK